MLRQCQGSDIHLVFLQLRFQLVLHFLCFQLGTEGFLAQQQQDHRQNDQQRAEDEIEIEVLQFLLSTKGVFLHLQVVFRLDALHLFAAVFLVGQHHALIEKLVVFQSSLVVAGKLIEVRQALVGRHSGAGLAALGGFVKVGQREAVLFQIIVGEAQSQVANVE